MDRGGRAGDAHADQLRSAGRGREDRQAVADFEKVYVLGLSDTASASGEDAIRRHFCAPRLEAMARGPRDWHVQSASGFLVFALSWTAPAADRPELWHEALELAQALLAPLFSPPWAPFPPRQGMDMGRQHTAAAGESRVPRRWSARLFRQFYCL